MAKQIKEIPVLTGKNAKRFQKIIKENEQKRISEEEYSRAKKAYSNFKLIH